MKWDLSCLDSISVLNIKLVFQLKYYLPRQILRKKSGSMGQRFPPDGKYPQTSMSLGQELRPKYIKHNLKSNI